MFHGYKQGVAAPVPICLKDAAGSIVTGVLMAAVTATIRKADGTRVALVVDGAQNSWVEETTGAFSGKGGYVLTIGAANMNVPGPMMIAVNGGTGSFLGTVTIVANQEKDVYDRIGAPAGASVSADIAAVKTDTGAVKAKTDNLPAVPASQGDVTSARDSIKGAGAKDLTQNATAIAAIPTTPLLSSDARLDRLDATVSSRARPADVQVTVDGGFSASDRTTLQAIPTDVATPANVTAARDAVIVAIPPAPNLTELETDIAAVKAKTDSLPALPASQGDVTTARDAVIAALPDAPDNLGISAIRARTDANLDVAVSTRAQPGDITAARDAVIAAMPQEFDVSTLSLALDEIKGLLHSNARLSNQQYNTAGKLVSAELRCYDSAANATLNDGVTGVVAIWDIASTYDSVGRNTSYGMTKR